MKTPASRKRALCITAIALLCAAVLALSACQPNAEPKTAGNAAQEAPSTTMPGNFLNNDSGYLPESFYANDYINAGNRGCNACHADLYALIESTNPLPHLLGPSRYGKEYTWTDCTTCHNMKSSFGGIALGDAVHAQHLSNESFVNDYAGNCFSCHALNSQNELVMWDEYKYSSDFGGYLNVGDPVSQHWNRRRGFAEGTISGMSVINDLAVDATLSQNVIDNPADLYVVNNYEIPEITEDEYTFTVTGTVEERTFTLAELKALPAAEKQVTQSCMTNPINSSLIASWNVKGVLLEDVIEACGGLAAGKQSVTIMCGDSWEAIGYMDVQTLIDRGSILAYEFFGQELTAEWGYPVVACLPGTGASKWGKWVVGLDFSDTPGATNDWATHAYMPKAIQGMICSGWFNPIKDGTEYKVGQTAVLDGYAYVSNQTDDTGIAHKLSQIAFSADYGATWTLIDVPASHDPLQWTRFEFPWTPEKAGTYCLQVKSIDEGGLEQLSPASVIVTVTE